MTNVLKVLAFAGASSLALAVAPMAASATTLTTATTVFDNTTSVTGSTGTTTGNPFLVGNADSYDLSYYVGAGDTINSIYYFKNVSSAPAFLSFASTIPGDPFSSQSVQLSTDGGATFTSAPINTGTLQIAIAKNGLLEVWAQATATGTGKLDYTVAPVPVPATGLLLLGGIGAFGALRRRKKKATA